MYVKLNRTPKCEPILEVITCPMQRSRKLNTYNAYDLALVGRDKGVVIRICMLN